MTPEVAAAVKVACACALVLWDVNVPLRRKIAEGFSLESLRKIWSNASGRRAGAMLTFRAAGTLSLARKSAQSRRIHQEKVL